MFGKITFTPARKWVRRPPSEPPPPPPPGYYLFTPKTAKFCSHFQNFKPVAFVVLELLNFLVKECGGTTHSHPHGPVSKKMWETLLWTVVVKIFD